MMSDSFIEQVVLQNIAVTKLPGCQEVCVLSREGIVSLDGTVPTRTAKLAMQRAALTVKGVIAVVNNLQSQPSRAARALCSSLESAKVAPDLRPAGSMSRRAVSTY
jgi:hypothetical protein